MTDYKCRIYPSDASDPIEFRTSRLAFVNSQSYGSPDRLGIPEDEDVTVINPANFVVLEITPNG
jgi:hypothetical protein